MGESNLLQARTIITNAGYTRERMIGGIYILRLHDSEPETIDSWYEDCLKLMARWQQGQRLRYLHDIRNAELITPHATDRVSLIIRRMRHIPVTNARGAILLNNQTVGLLLKTFFRRETESGWYIRFFNEEAKALAWLGA